MERRDSERMGWWQTCGTVDHGPRGTDFEGTSPSRPPDLSIAGGLHGRDGVVDAVDFLTADPDEPAVELALRPFCWGTDGRWWCTLRGMSFVALRVQPHGWRLTLPELAPATQPATGDRYDALFASVGGDCPRAPDGHQLRWCPRASRIR